MIKSIVLENYRGHERTEIPLQQFTLLVGDNGVGKSSVLSAIEELTLALAATDKSAPFQPEGRRAPDDAVSISLGGTHQGNVPWSFKMTFTPIRTEARLVCEWLEEGGTPKSARVSELSTVVSNALDSTLAQFSNSGVFAFERRALAAPSIVDSVVPRLRPDGYGLATTLASLKLSKTDAFIRIEKAAQKVVTNLNAIAIGRAEITLSEPGEKPRTAIADELRLTFTNARQELPASVASEGTLIALGILTILQEKYDLLLPRWLLSNQSPKVVLLDDLDRGLHPRAQAELVAAIRAVLAERPDVQVIATSHSPYLVDAFRPEEIVVLSRDEKGKVRARPLTAHPDVAMLKALKTGEFLAATGKDWFGL